jgi:hypothetical protein
MQRDENVLDMLHQVISCVDTVLIDFTPDYVESIYTVHEAWIAHSSGTTLRVQSNFSRQQVEEELLPEKPIDTRKASCRFVEEANKIHSLIRSGGGGHRELDYVLTEALIAGANPYSGNGTRAPKVEVQVDPNAAPQSPSAQTIGTLGDTIADYTPKGDGSHLLLGITYQGMVLFLEHLELIRLLVLHQRTRWNSSQPERQGVARA